MRFCILHFAKHDLASPAARRAGESLGLSGHHRSPRNRGVPLSGILQKHAVVETQFRRGRTESARPRPVPRRRGAARRHLQSFAFRWPPSGSTQFRRGPTPSWGACEDQIGGTVECSGCSKGPVALRGQAARGAGLASVGARASPVDWLRSPPPVGEPQPACRRGLRGSARPSRVRRGPGFGGRQS